MAGFWGLFKWPRASPKSEQVPELVDKLIMQNKECIEIIKEQRDLVIKATEALTENMNATKELLEKLNGSVDLGDVTPPNYIN